MSNSCAGEGVGNSYRTANPRNCGTTLTGQICLWLAYKLCWSWLFHPAISALFCLVDQTLYQSLCSWLGLVGLAKFFCSKIMCIVVIITLIIRSWQLESRFWTTSVAVVTKTLQALDWHQTLITSIVLNSYGVSIPCDNLYIIITCSSLNHLATPKLGARHCGGA